MAARLVALLPAKRLAFAKSRLAGRLSEAERASLSLEMLRAVAKRLAACPDIAAWAVVSADEQALLIAAALGGEQVLEPHSGLNVALDLGRHWALDMGAESLLVVPSDVPLISEGDVAGLVQRSEQAEVVIAPSNDGGTNALLLRPPAAIPFRFGRRSAAHHRFEAERAGLGVSFVHSPTLSFDVDTPADYAAYMERLELAGA